MEDNKSIVALEIGSSKVKGAIGQVDANGVLSVQAIEEAPMTDYVRYGIVSNVEEVASLVSTILRKIENRISPRKVESVYVSIGGRSLGATAASVEHQLPDEMEVTSTLIEQLKRELSRKVGSERMLFEVLPNEYTVDGVRHETPIGTFGRRVTMSANLVTSRQQLKRNLDRLLVDKLGLKINDYVVRQLAEADFVLTSEEKRLGCMLVDFGAETTTISIYKGGKLNYLATIPMGSRNITRDITNMNYLEEQAEEIKLRNGNAGQQPVNADNMGTGDSVMIHNYVSYRAGEIIENIKAQISFAKLTVADLPAGIILVGRGLKLVGFMDRLSKVTGMKVRIGNSIDNRIRFEDGHISPSESTDVLALLYYAAKHNPKECLTPRPVVVPVVEEPEVKVETPEEPDKEQIEEISPKEPNPKKRSFLATLKTRIIDIMKDSDEDDDDDIMREDQ